MKYEPLVGDVVELNSGGPAMSVIAQCLNNVANGTVLPSVYCAWINGYGIAQQCVFPCVCVHKKVD